MSSSARSFPGILAKRNSNGSHAHVSGAAFDKSELGSEGAGVTEAEITDEALLLRLQENDISALGPLYRRYARIVYSVCVRLLRDPIEAEDLVHEVFLCLHKRCASFDPTKGTVRSWLVHMTYHKCFDWREYLRARHGFHRENGEGKSPSAASELMEERGPAQCKISADDIKALLAKLPREQQLTFQMRVAGYTFSEIGEKLGCSPGNAKHHAYRGVQRLRRIVFDVDKLRANRAAQRGTKLQAKSAIQ